MKIIYTLSIAALISVLFFSCKNKNITLMEEANSYIIKAAQSPEKIIDIPFGFKFNMSVEAAEKYVDSLKKKGLIAESKFPKFYYKYAHYKNLVSYIELYFYKNKLCRLAYHFNSNKEYEEWDKEYSKTLEPLYHSPKLYDYIIQNDKIKDEKHLDKIKVGVNFNLVCTLKDIKYAGLFEDETVYIFDNQPVSKFLTPYKTEKEISTGSDRIKKILEAENWEVEHKDELNKIKTEIENRPKIENSTYDGSVSCVKKYLKTNLKDPDSYEGIEWGNVQSKGIGYQVWHKYRAKNSFGGYVISTQLFDIDENGNITKASKIE